MTMIVAGDATVKAAGTTVERIAAVACTQTRSLISVQNAGALANWPPPKGPTDMSDRMAEIGEHRNSLREIEDGIERLPDVTTEKYIDVVGHLLTRLEEAREHVEELLSIAKPEIPTCDCADCNSQRDARRWLEGATDE